MRKGAALLADVFEPRGALDSVFGNSLLEITGRELSSGRSLSLLYAGGGHNLGYFVNCLFDDFAVQRKLRLRSPLALRRAIRGAMAGSDLLIIDAGAMTARFEPGTPGLRVPPWVRQRLELAEDWAVTAAGISRSARRKAERQLRNGGFECSFSTSARDFFDFYHKLYRPSLRHRFAGAAVIAPLDRFQAECRRGYLLQIRQHGEVRAAALVQRFGRHMASVWGGVEFGADGTPVPGLSDLLDYCTIRHAWQQGCRRLDLGPSRPRLFDGVLQYKKKWGSRIGFPHVPRADLVVKPLRMNAAVTGFLSTAALIVRDRSGPVAKLLFTDAPCTGAALEQVFRRNAVNGIARYEIFAMAGIDGGARDWARASGHVVGLVDLSRAARPEEAFCRAARAEAF